MSGDVNQAAIFIPMLVVILLTIVGFGKMAMARARVNKEKTVPESFYKIYQGPPYEPEYAVAAARHYNNLMELPTVFYAGCLVAFSLSAVTMWSLVWAWGYVLFRLIQSGVHMTSNKPLARGIAFSISFPFVVALWVSNAIAIFAEM